MYLKLSLSLEPGTVRVCIVFTMRGGRFPPYGIIPLGTPF